MSQAPRLLVDAELTGDDFRDLLCEASGATGEQLEALHDHVVAEFIVFGIGHDNLDGFAAYRVDGEGILLKYIGVRAATRHSGIGRALVQAIRELHPALPFRAQTDDDAVGFYRALGCDVQRALANPRWPRAVRYDCALPPLNQA